jgi:DNA-directed RNA polymerase subunit N (RpoN/RPB10)
MIIPVRCFTCGKVLADKWEAYVRRCREAGQGTGNGTDADADAEAKADARAAAAAAASPDAADDGKATAAVKTARGVILDELGITRSCCRIVMMTHVDLSLVI